MKSNRLKWMLALMAIAGLTYMTGCKKADNATLDAEVESANAEADSYSNDAYELVDNALQNNGGAGKSDAGDAFRGCATVTFDPGGASDTTGYISFSGNCTDGRTRSGKIFFRWTGPRRGHLRNTTLWTDSTGGADRYLVNGNEHRIFKRVTNQGLVNNIPTWHVFVKNTILYSQANGGGQSTWRSGRVRRWTQGFTAPSTIVLPCFAPGCATPWEFQISALSGSVAGIGTSRNGTSYTVSITNPLVYRSNCRYTVAGTLVIEGGNRTRTVDFGNGSCDGTFTVTSNGITRTFNKP